MNNREKSKNFDKTDILSHFKSRFYNPENLIYLDGNSLGKLPIGAKKVVSKIVDEQWGEKLIRSWNDHWLELPKKIGSKIAQLINAEKNEVIVGDSTSVNLFKLACALINSKIFPKKLITDTLNFPTDNYILDGICKQYSLSNLKSIKYSNDIEAEIPLLKETIKNFPGILCLSLVTYKSSYLYPIKELNDYANKNNSIIIWDFSHAIGVVDIDIRETNTLAAIGCTYKYLNGGPGSPAFMYVDNSLISKLTSPIQGWFGHKKPFDFSMKYEPSTGIEKFDAGTKNIISLAALETGIDLTLEAGIKNISEKSQKMTTYLVNQVKNKLNPLGYTIESPQIQNKRGSHITLSHPESWRICQCLSNPPKNKIKIIPDFRPDRFIRLGIAPLYLSFQDLDITVKRLEEIITKKEYEKKDGNRPKVT
jgi:kynureninase